jgi:uncharacterized protein (DUF849 family)
MQYPVSAVGAGAFHITLANSEDHGRLDPEVVSSVVARVRVACKVPVGVTTGEWIERMWNRTPKLVREWRVPDYTTVNYRSRGQWR